MYDNGSAIIRQKAKQMKIKETLCYLVAVINGEGMEKRPQTPEWNMYARQYQRSFKQSATKQNI